MAIQSQRYQALIIGFGKAGKTLAVYLAGQGWWVALMTEVLHDLFAKV